MITGLSGSGKSSLAFDTLYAEGQRRYVESLSAYARQFLQMMDKPDVDLIEGLHLRIAIEQKATSHNPRSTVGTVTEIHDYLRLLYARVGDPYCPNHPEIMLSAQTISQMVDTVLAGPQIPASCCWRRSSPTARASMSSCSSSSRPRALRACGSTARSLSFDPTPKLAKNHKHTIEGRRGPPQGAARRQAAPDGIVRDGLPNGAMVARLSCRWMMRRQSAAFSSKFACPICDYSLAELEPRLFSFNSPMGACPTCDGLGEIDEFEPGRIVAHPELSLASGAIKGWDRRTIFYFQMLQGLAAHYGFDLETPFAELPEEARHAVVYGSGEEVIEFDYVSEKGVLQKRKHTFEGVLPNFRRRYRETESGAVREELAKYMSWRDCPDCHGARLRREARARKWGRANRVGQFTR